MAAVFFVWMLLSPDADDITHTRPITGTISEIHDRGANASNNPKMRHGMPPKLVIAVVELPDGGHARVLVPRGRFEVGADIPLTLTLYKNGDRKITPRQITSGSETKALEQTELVPVR